jgi:hypothetical protein
MSKRNITLMKRGKCLDAAKGSGVGPMGLKRLAEKAAD